jgi:hypothetical protein
MILTHSALLVLLSLPLTLAAPAKGRPRTRKPLAKRTLYYTDGGQVSNKNYDYVIAGGGLTGVVLAKRLSEDASKTILLIEAGYDQENNPEVYGGSSMPRRELRDDVEVGLMWTTQMLRSTKRHSA